MTKGNKQWVSELISDDYTKWSNRIILLACGTGRGKTTFALGIYCKYLLSVGKKVLYICNRTKLKEQIRADKERYGIDGVEITSYQKFAEDLRSGSEPQYDVYICDEAHYFLADAGFNLYTDIPYEYIMNQTAATRVFMTATYKNIFGRIRKDLERTGEEPLEYHLPTDYSYVENIYWFKKKDDLFGIVDRILNTTNDTVIYFCNSIKKMREFYNHYSPNRGKGYSEDKKFLKDSKLQYMSFMCSGNSSEDEKETSGFVANYCSSDHIKRNSHNDGYYIDNRILITTKVIDNGVDFKDRKVKHIICDVFDIESAIQCLGRKRVIDEKDTCNFYLRDWQYYELNLFLKPVKENLKPPTMLIEDKEEWIKKYGTNRNYKDGTTYFDFNNNQWRINYLRYDKLLSDKATIESMIKQETSYREEILSHIGEYENCIEMEDIKADQVKDAIEIWITEHMEQYLSNEQKQELISLCDLKDKYGRQQKSIGILSNYLKDNYRFTITNKQHRVDKKRVKQWVISPYDDSDCQKMARPPC